MSCRKELGPAPGGEFGTITCDGLHLCSDCHLQTKPSVVISYPPPGTPLGEWVEVIDAALVEHAPVLRGLGHKHVQLDANARVYIARLAVAALTKAGALVAP